VHRKLVTRGAPFEAALCAASKDEDSYCNCVRQDDAGAAWRQHLTALGFAPAGGAALNI
jgi:hypothetical protein